MAAWRPSIESLFSTQPGTTSTKRAPFVEDILPAARNRVRWGGIEVEPAARSTVGDTALTELAETAEERPWIAGHS